MRHQIYLFSEISNPRVNYVFKLIFIELLNFDKVNIISDISAFNNIENHPKLTYSYEPILNTPFLAIGTKLLSEQDINDHKPSFVKGTMYGYFFELNDTRALFPFDLPAAIFWLVSRYEEYQFFEPDKHGRFSAFQSFAYQQHFLELPLVNLWVDELEKKLKSIYPEIIFPNRKAYNFLPSYDIDHAWAFKNKGFLRNIAGGLLELAKLKFNHFFERISVLSGIKEDPYFTFDYIENLHKNDSNKPLIFWLLGDYSAYDKNTSHKLEQFQTLITIADKLYDSGIHPSYFSDSKKQKIELELKRLENILNKKITKSRQHYLKLNFPDTYQNLLACGITDEYSMGYAEKPGFRASIAHSFLWYDLKNERETNLRIHPFMLMDVTLHTYMKLSPEAALDAVKLIVQNTMDAGGELISIWHNNSFCEEGAWKGWRKMYEQFLQQATKK